MKYLPFSSFQSRNKNTLPLTFAWSLFTNAQTHIFTLREQALTYAYMHVHTHTHTPSELPMGTNTTCHLLIFSMQMIMIATISGGFPDGSNGKESACKYRRPGCDPWVRKIPWRREWLPTPLILPGESHGQRSLVSYSPWGHKKT